MTQNDLKSSEEIGAVLGLDSKSSGRRRLWWLIGTGVVLLLVVTAYFLLRPSEGTALSFETAEVQRGDLTVTVTATGTVQPVNQVDVGSELSGTIDEVLVDFNDQVKRGQLLARLDTERLQAQVIEARASLESAKAKVEEAKATVLETRVRFERCQKLAARQLCTGEELDTTRAGHMRARAAEASAKAQVAVAQAALEADETNLDKAEIRSRVVYPGRGFDPHGTARGRG